ncbi:MAG: diaminopimelate decarboxylase [Bacteroidetes bacterium]|nr:diaminopimelate decarboxylase [Bacteroidota bacterium]
MFPHLAPPILIEAAHQFGTPLYVYHADRIRFQYQSLKQAFSNWDVRFFYAVKALTNLQILRYVDSLGCAVDCSSINEIKLALKAKIACEKILYTSNGINFTEIEEAVTLGVYVNVDSLSALEKFGKRFGDSYPVGIRLRPNIMAGGNLKISTGHAASKFGIPVEQLDQVLALISSYKINVQTLHIHTGSEIKDAEVFVQGIHLLLGIVANFPDVCVINLGGGFKVPYYPNEKGTDIHELGHALATLFTDYQQKTGRQLQVWFEPGKYLVCEAGYLLTTVNVLKENEMLTFAGVDTGLNQLIRPMFYDAYHHIENLTNPLAPVHTYTIVGNICETDTLGANRSMPTIREGDLLSIQNAGAYGFEMASSYNARLRPAEVLYKDGTLQLIRRRETLEDLVQTQESL